MLGVLVADAGRIGQQEVAWATGRVIRIGDRCGRRSRGASHRLQVMMVTAVGNVVRAACVMWMGLGPVRACSAMHPASEVATSTATANSSADTSATTVRGDAIASVAVVVEALATGCSEEADRSQGE